MSLALANIATFAKSGSIPVDVWQKFASTPHGLRFWSLVLGNIDASAKVAGFRWTCGKSWRLTIRGRDYASWAASFVTGPC